MRQRLCEISAALILTAATACGGTGMAGGKGGSGPANPNGLTPITLADETVMSTFVPHVDDTVTAIWFGDMSHGIAATLHGGTNSPAGSLQALSSPTQVS